MQVDEDKAVQKGRLAHKKMAVALVAVLIGVVAFAVWYTLAGRFGGVKHTAKAEVDGSAQASVAEPSVEEESGEQAKQRLTLEDDGELEPRLESSVSREVEAPGSDLDSWNLVLVNQEHPITDEDMEKIDLVEIEKHCSRTLKIDRRIQPELERMIADAADAGIDLIIISAFRTVDYQAGLFADKVNSLIKEGVPRKQAIEEAAGWVAKPKTSEHHTGLALDITSQEAVDLNERFEQTKAFAWLFKNSQNYGFILRYPRDKKEFTFVNYEPWHFRFVGQKLACAIKESGLCLEEFLENMRQEQEGLYMQQAG